MLRLTDLLKIQIQTIEDARDVKVELIYLTFWTIPHPDYPLSSFARSMLRGILQMHVYRVAWNGRPDVAHSQVLNLSLEKSVSQLVTYQDSLENDLLGSETLVSKLRNDLEASKANYLTIEVGAFPTFILKITTNFRNLGQPLTPFGCDRSSRREEWWLGYISGCC